MERKTQLRLAKLGSRLELDTLRSDLEQMELTGHWRKYADYLIDFIDTGKPRFSVFAKGNSKLPFYSFSALPIYTCPGLAQCAKWCYSLKAWRYPAAFFRQLQNTILIVRHDDELIKAWNKIKPNSTIRLYVDGDFDSIETLRFWMRQLHSRPDLKAYGYSKSLHLFKQAHEEGLEWPTNYKLNLSSGGRYMAHMVEGIPVVRGEFIAVPIDRAANKSGYATREYNDAVRTSAEKLGHGKVFVCPGKCGSCTRKGHACGMDSFDGITIAIGIH